MYALDTVDLEVKSGEFLTLLGPSGSGKTTLLMAIAGFNRPDAGSIRFADTEMILTPPHKRDVGMVFQSYALFPHMTVSENIAFPLKLRNVETKEKKQRVQEALDTVQLSDLGNRNIDQLSGGQRQRVALARAFVFKPQILLMDEPLSALDKKLREHMQIELKRIHEQLGVTTVYVTHDQREALTMSDRIAVINDGKIAQIDTPHAIYNQPSNQFVADFIGESSILPLTLEADNKLSFSGQNIRTDVNLNSARQWGLLVRPERLFVADKNSLSIDEHLIFNGIVRDFVYQGETAYAVATINQSYELAFRFGTDASSTEHMMQTGDEITLGLNRHDTTVIPLEQIDQS